MLFSTNLLRYYKIVAFDNWKYYVFKSVLEFNNISHIETGYELEHALPFD